jgi:hypothetical protein
MDLTTLKERISDLDTVEDFLLLAQRIWNNCREFNDPGADIVSLAYELADYIKEAVVVRDSSAVFSNISTRDFLYRHNLFLCFIFIHRKILVMNI